MLTLSQFSIIEVLKKDEKTAVYRCARKKDDKSFIIKTLVGEHPDLASVYRLHHEYDLLQSLEIPGIPKPLELTKFGNQVAMVFEDKAEVVLSHLIEEAPLSIGTFLNMAIELTTVIGKLHELGIVHKDIKPTNILVDKETSHVKLIDFNIVSKLPREVQAIINPNRLEGTLAYMSPEQTGRTSRGIDYRSDFYSLGVTFYEMLTGQLPFEAPDALGMVHAHLAKTAIPPNAIRSEIPQIVSDIITKLMAKTAEERYQGAYGLTVDLEQCWAQFNSTGSIRSFKLAQRDIPTQFQVSQKLYGRDEEIAQLIEAFEEASSNKIVIASIGGYSGVGKTTLVHELNQAIVAKTGYFTSGKFEQLNRNIPYSGWMQVIQDLVHQILMAPKENLQIWKENILAAIKDNEQIMVDFAPELETIIGKQPPSEAVAAHDSENRFYWVMKNFLNLFAQSQHPLVIFLDDLQWASSPSLKLLVKLLLQFELKNVLIVCAYRDNEVTAGHPFSLALEEIEIASALHYALHLNPLDASATTALIADTLASDKKRVQALANKCFEKTQGNPFYLNQFLQLLYSENFIFFDPHQGAWEWDLEKVSTAQATDNVVELLIDKLHKLAPATQHALHLASCIGSRFSLQMLSALNKLPPTTMADILWPALQEGYILPCDDTYKFAQEFDGKSIYYKFLHDRMVNAAYQLNYGQDSTEIHYQIGRYYINYLSPEDQNEKVFEITNQLNLSRTFITSEEEKIDLAQRNLFAGNKAKASVAYEIAIHHLSIGIDLLGEASWETNYALMLALHLEATEACYLNANFDQMQKLADTTIQHSKHLIDAVKIYQTQINRYVFNGENKEATIAGLNALKLLGVHMPENPTLKDIAIALLKFRIRLFFKPIRTLIHLPDMVDPKINAIMLLMNTVWPSMYFSNPLLVPINTIKMVELSMKYGNSPYSNTAYMGCFILFWITNDIKYFPSIIELGEHMIQRFPNRREQVMAQVLMAIFGRPWISHLKLSQPLLLEAYETAVSSGILDTAGTSALMYCFHDFWLGKNLDSIAKNALKFQETLKQFKQDMLVSALNLVLQIVNENLQQKTQNPTLLVGHYYNEMDFIENYEKNKKDEGHIHSIHITKIFLSYLFGDYEQVISILSKIKTEVYIGFYSATIANLYQSLALLMLYPNASAKQKRQYLRIVKTNQKKMRIWAKHAPMNFLHKYYLVHAELNRVLGRKEVAAQHYDLAIKHAQKNDYFHEEGLANELAARFYIANENTKLAKIYIADAHYSYLKWGAIGKVKQVEKEFSDYFSTGVHYSTHTGDTISIQHSVTDQNTQLLDFFTIIKSSQVISSEIVLPTLIVKILNIMIENVCADRCVLLLESSQSLFIEGEYQIGDEPKNILQSIPLEKSQDIPRSIIEFVQRTRKNFVATNSNDRDQFKRDPYFKTKKPKSILCAPIMNHGELIGLLYLENSIAPDVFTEERLEALNSLSVQAAISIENARLYNTFERFVPKPFLSFLEKRSLVDIKPGDSIQKVLSILFIDIHGFTTLSEQLAPTEVFKFINTYLSYMEPVITKNGGFIDKYMGDGIMALFPDQAEDAVKTALGAQHALDKYNASYSSRLPIKAGIGLNTGPAMLGIIGSENRMDGSVIGDAVNTASRVMDLNQYYDTIILISDNTYHALKNPEQFQFRLLDRVRFKGKHEPILIWELMDAYSDEIRDNMLKIIGDYQRAWQLYQQKEFTEAGKLFAACLAIAPHDRPSQLFLERCNYYAKNGCPMDWDGTTTMQTKF